MYQLSDEIKITVCIGYTGATTGDADAAAGVNMEGYQGVLFIAKFGTAADNNTIHAEQSANDSSYAELADSQVHVGTSESNEIVWLDINQHVGDRYIRPTAERGTSTTLEFLIALQYRSKSIPCDNVTAGTITGAVLTSPAEGAKE
jgi:hypothetical protein